MIGMSTIKEKLYRNIVWKDEFGQHICSLVFLFQSLEISVVYWSSIWVSFYFKCFILDCFVTIITIELILLRLKRSMYAVTLCMLDVCYLQLSLTITAIYYLFFISDIYSTLLLSASKFLLDRNYSKLLMIRRASKYFIYYLYTSTDIIDNYILIILCNKRRICKIFVLLGRAWSFTFVSVRQNRPGTFRYTFL